MMKTARRRRLARSSVRANTDHREAGFTLVEMLVVIAIIGLVVGLVGPRVLNYLSESKVKAAKIQIESFSAALDLYYLDNGGYPGTSDGLNALVERPASALAWNGPYLKTGSVPVDPWGHPYIYKFPGDHGDVPDIVCLGADGQPGGEGINGDIVSWKAQ